MTFRFDSLPSLLTMLRSSCYLARCRYTTWLTAQLAHDAPLTMLGSAGRFAVDTLICLLPMLLLAVCSAR
jgi:hypothetical protein